MVVLFLVLQEWVLLKDSEFQCPFWGVKKNVCQILAYYSQKALNCRRWVISTTIIFFIFPTLDMSHILDKTSLEMHVAPWIFSMSEVVVY